MALANRSGTATAGPTGCNTSVTLSLPWSPHRRGRLLGQSLHDAAREGEMLLVTLLLIPTRTIVGVSHDTARGRGHIK